MTLVLVSMLGTLLLVASLSCLLCSSWARWTSWTSCSWWRTPGKLLDNGERIKPGVKKGDTVVFGKYSGSEVEIKNVTHLIVRESELLGVIEG